MEEQNTPAIYQKRDGKWYCTLRGRQRYLGKNLDLAREKVKGLLEGREEGKGIETMDEFAEAYLASLRNNQSPDTNRTKDVTYRDFLEFVGERTRVTGITPETIERYKQHGFALFGPHSFCLIRALTTSQSSALEGSLSNSWTRLAISSAQRLSASGSGGHRGSR